MLLCREGNLPNYVCWVGEGLRGSKQYHKRNEMKSVTVSTYLIRPWRSPFHLCWKDRYRAWIWNILLINLYSIRIPLVGGFSNSNFLPLIFLFKFIRLFNFNLDRYWQFFFILRVVNHGLFLHPFKKGNNWKLETFVSHLHPLPSLSSYFPHF